MACICAFQKALSGVFPPNKSAGSECPLCCTTSQVHEAFLRAIFFCPSGAPAQCSCQAAGASRFQHRLSSFLLHRANNRLRRRIMRLSPALGIYISTLLGRSTSRLCSCLNSHESEVGGEFRSHSEPSFSLIQVHSPLALIDEMP